MDKSISLNQKGIYKDGEWRYGIFVHELPSGKESILSFSNELRKFSEMLPEGINEYGHRLEIDRDYDETGNLVILKVFAYLSQKDREVKEKLQQHGITDLPVMTVEEQDAFLQENVVKTSVISRIRQNPGGWGAGYPEIKGQLEKLKDKGYKIED